jgi:hypothetical protein
MGQGGLGVGDGSGVRDSVPGIKLGGGGGPVRRFHRIKPQGVDMDTVVHESSQDSPRLHCYRQDGRR